MKAGAIIALTTVGVAAAAGISYYAWARNQLDFKIGGVDFSPPVNGALTVKVKFLIKNGTGISFTVTSMQCNIFLNNQFIGIAGLAQQVLIPGNSTIPIEVVIQLKASDATKFAFNYALGFLGGSRAASNFIIDGVSKARINTWLPITVNYPVNETYSL